MSPKGTNHPKQSGELSRSPSRRAVGQRETEKGQDAQASSPCPLSREPNIKDNSSHYIKDGGEKEGGAGEGDAGHLRGLCGKT